MNRKNGAPATKRVEGETYRFEGTDLRDEQLADLRSQGFSVRTFYNARYRETETYIFARWPA